MSKKRKAFELKVTDQKDVTMNRIDLSSNEPHINNECPFCHHAWMQRVDDAARCPGCDAPFTMKKDEDGSVIVSWPL